MVSVSWGAPEDTDIWTDQAMTQMNETFKEAALLGVTICIAAGDDGSSDADMDGHAHADFPSSSPYVLAVGGTTIPTKGGTQPDIVWKEGDGKSAPDQDPAQNQFTALIYFAKFARGGVPVGADRDPDKEPIPPVLSIPSSR